MAEYITTIGIEVHLQLSTNTKAFCSCANIYGAEPNTLTCPICLGHPGTLPVPNRNAIEYAIMASLALNCRLNTTTRYDRKNYFYPDLPKNFQISQYNIPLGEDGFLDFYVGDTWERPTRWLVRRVHLEEDTAKIIHTETSSLLDFNRAGVPLLEIVSEPMKAKPLEAYFYIRALRATMLTLGISTCNMEEGSLRCDTNISVNKEGENIGMKVEIKNLNSLKAVRLSLEYERDRQIKLLMKGEGVEQETRLWDEQREITISMRGKEETADYRYFPEPDIPPIVITDGWLGEIKAKMSSLPTERMELLKGAGVSCQEATTLVERPYLYSYFDEVRRHYGNIKTIVNWIIGELNSIAQKKNIDYADIPIKPANFAEFVKAVDEDKISTSAGKDVLLNLWEGGDSVLKVIEELGLAKVSDESALIPIINEVISENPDVIAIILKGKEQAIGKLIGDVMKKSKGNADPKVVQKLLREQIDKLKKN
ncbi:MAG: Asp-tRNA(Asn)/Glu-tRNA(Gln) amidotransferase subunit GatB [bacterium]